MTEAAVKGKGAEGAGSGLEAVRARLAAAEAAAGRPPGSVALIAVSKEQPEDRVRAVLEAGHRLFGENRVQEATAKIAALDGALRPRWHLIGHLQRNKARRAAGAFAMIHSVDGPALARALDRAARELGRRIPVLLEVNVAGEPSKFGVKPQEAGDLVREVLACPYLEAVGLMTVAPLCDDPEAVRPVFRRLRLLRRPFPGGGGARPPVPGAHPQRLPLVRPRPRPGRHARGRRRDPRRAGAGRSGRRALPAGVAAGRGRRRP